MHHFFRLKSRIKLSLKNNRENFESCLHQKKGVTKRDNVVMSKINSNRMKHHETSHKYL